MTVGFDSRSGPGQGRIVALTDGVVAIAMTLLVLPVVDSAGRFDTSHPAQWWRSDGDLLVSFAVSFLVIYVFWSAHTQALRAASERVGAVPHLAALNMLWLLVVAFLPFPTAVVGHHLDTTSAPIYIGTMLLLSGLTSAIVSVTARLGMPGASVRWAWVTTGVFAACTAVSAWLADAGLFGLLALVAVRVVEIRRRGAHSSLSRAAVPRATEPEHSDE